MQEKARMTPEIKLLHQNFKMGRRAGVASERAKCKTKITKLRAIIVKLKTRRKK